MPEFDLTRKSRPVVVTAYQPHWVDEFTEMARHIRDVVGQAAIRIDHIGSTAIPGLGAKDVIDIQITVADLDAADGLTNPLRAAGFLFPDSIDGYLFLKDRSFISFMKPPRCGQRRSDGCQTRTTYDVPQRETRNATS
jgi:GrpB-like predicted nucleotidyltransferase (UPF0157 family)